MIAVILAGGEGRRIGGDKPRRLLAGRSLLTHALDRARSWTDCVAVAGAAAPGAPVLEDDPAIAGPLGGLAVALRFAQAQGSETALILPCDMPFLPEDLPIRLTAALGPANAALAASNGRLHPVCAFWRTAALDVLPAYLAGPSRSLRGFAEQAGYASVEWPGDPFLNINDEEDLARAEAMMAG